MESLKLPENRENKFLIDWLSFTSKIDSDNSIFQFLGLESIKQHFQIIYGFQGYRSRLFFDGISIHFNHPKNEGVWIEMSGQGCRNFETYSTKSFSDLFELLIDDEESYHITRLDVAYDDFSGVIPLKKLAKQILDFHFVSKFNGRFCTVTQAAGRQGITCDLGSRKSDLKFRIYDKAYERGYFEEIKQLHFYWVRWELQLRDDRAFNFIVQAASQPVGEVFKGVLSHYFRVVDVNKQDSNKRRWLTSKWFIKFLGAVENISLFTPCKVEYNLFKCERFVYTQAGNAIDTLIKIKGLPRFLQELAASKSDTSPKYIQLLNEYQAQMQADQNGAELLDYLKEDNLE